MKRTGGRAGRLLAAGGFLLAAAATARAQGGALGEYYDQLDFAGGAVLSRIDPTISFDWGNAFAPDPQPPGITAINTFTVRWSGLVETPVGASGVYTFRTTADDGVRVWVDGRLVLDRWRDQSITSATQSITLAGGQRYGLRLDYFQNPTYARVRLEWMVPGTGAFVIVPQSALYPIVAAPKISPAAGTYSDTVTVTMTSDTFGSQIWYTLDGVTPPTAGAPSIQYTGPFTVNANTTVMARAFRPGTLLTQSAVTTATFRVNDIVRPSLVTAQAPTATQIVVVFSEAVEQTSAQTAGNYTLTGPGSPAIMGAVLSGDLRTVFLSLTTGMTPGGSYLLTVNNVTDRDSPANAVPANSGIAFVFPTFPATCLTNYYSLDDPPGNTVVDGGPGANNGTLTGPSGLPARIIGYLGQGVAFDGVDDSVALAADLQPVLGGTATLACWVRTVGQGNIPVRAPGIAGGVIQNPVNTANTNDIVWGWLDQNGRIGISAGPTADAGTNPEPVNPNPQPNTAQSSIAVNDGQWHHVAFTRNSTSGALQVYVDGVLRGAGTGETGVKTAVCQSIGRVTNTRGSAGHPVFFLGDLDDIRIFNCILTAPEVQTLANRPPVVNAGPDQSVALMQPAALNGSYTDDGFPSGGPVTIAWTASPTAGVNIANPFSLSTTVTFTNPGIYILRLTVSDGALTTSDELIVSYGMIGVAPLSITTMEQGPGTASFNVVLNVQPQAGETVSIRIRSSDLTEGTVSSATDFDPGPEVELRFDSVNWNTAQTVVVTGVDDPLFDGDIAYTIVLDPATSGDPAFNGFNPADVAALNVNDDIPPPLERIWGGCGASIEAGAAGWPTWLALAGVLAWLRRRCGRRTPA
jgi:hypothetical protein